LRSGKHTSGGKRTDVRKGDMLSDERLLASNGEFSPSELNGIVDKIVDKQPVGWEFLES
jgi:hypothetical protein